MKIAILHNYLDNIGGAQVALFTWARELGAAVYSTVVDQAAIHAMGFDIPVRSIGWVPTNAPYRHQAAAARFRHLNLSRHYDAFIIAGDWALAAAVNNKPNIWWCHTPSRELWDLYQRTRQTNVPRYQHRLFDIWVAHNRRLNKKYAAQVNTIIASSHNAQARIKKYFNRDANVVYPPVDTSDFYTGANHGYWLSVNRLISYKRIELQLAAWAKMPSRKLFIVGATEPASHFQRYRKKLEQHKPPNVTFLPPQPRAELLKLYAHCEGFITTSHNEDFGLTAVEAMAAGKPVVAPNEGGYRETIIDNQTGHLIKATPENIIQAVTTVATDPTRYQNAARQQAKKFDTAVTVNQFKQQLAQPHDQHRSSALPLDHAATS